MKNFCLIGFLVLLNFFSQTSAETPSVTSEINQEGSANATSLTLSNDSLEKFSHPLPVDKAFKLSATLLNNNTLSVRWLVEQDYYLYKDKISFSFEEASIENINFPNAIIKNDEFFGEVSVYNTPLEVKIDLNSIQSAKKVMYSKYILNRSVYNLHLKGTIRFYTRGPNAVELIDKDGLIYLIGSQNSVELERIINQELS